MAAELELPQSPWGVPESGSRLHAADRGSPARAPPSSSRAPTPAPTFGGRGGGEFSPPQSLRQRSAQPQRRLGLLRTASTFAAAPRQAGAGQESGTPGFCLLGREDAAGRSLWRDSASRRASTPCHEPGPSVVLGRCPHGAGVLERGGPDAAQGLLEGTRLQEKQSWCRNREGQGCGLTEKVSGQREHRRHLGKDIPDKKTDSWSKGPGAGAGLAHPGNSTEARLKVGEPRGREHRDEDAAERLDKQRTGPRMGLGTLHSPGQELTTWHTLPSRHWSSQRGRAGDLETMPGTQGRGQAAGGQGAGFMASSDPGRETSLVGHGRVTSDQPGGGTARMKGPGKGLAVAQKATQGTMATTGPRSPGEWSLC
ncbi:uncharacterized protein LOC117200994 [Orcinus orca]|uniref:uncharacterized protein LOC117200994 n=1 Tax=Orcinus orca TaxID=9733 RepID=UPI0021134016|nr:uncharacterized protein LOC117200994 [Orcinus orca]